METPECPIKSLSLDEAIAHADEVAGDCGTACKREHKQLADWLRELKSRRSAERGDCAKLREALGKLRAELWNNTVIAGKRKFELYEIADAALSAPPRNCDVGTAKEQDERFHRFCKCHRTGSCAGCHNPVGDYTVANGVRECALVWAQMPYEEGGAK